jgi:hypothetical protein
VDDETDVVRLGHEVLKAGEDSLGGVRRRRRDLSRRGSLLRLVDDDEVGEGASDVYRNSVSGHRRCARTLQFEGRSAPRSTESWARTSRSRRVGLSRRRLRVRLASGSYEILPKSRVVEPPQQLLERVGIDLATVP